MYKDTEFPHTNRMQLTAVPSQLETSRRPMARQLTGLPIARLEGVAACGMTAVTYVAVFISRA